MAASEICGINSLMIIQLLPRIIKLKVKAAIIQLQELKLVNEFL